MIGSVLVPAANRIVRFPVKALYRGLISQQGGDDIAVFGSLLLPDDYIIPIENPGANHAVTFHPRQNNCHRGDLRRSGK